MPFTISEKILAAHTGREGVRPGDLIEADLDFVLGNDITAPLAIEAFRQCGSGRVFDPKRVCLVPDTSRSVEPALSTLFCPRPVWYFRAI